MCGRWKEGRDEEREKSLREGSREREKKGTGEDTYSSSCFLLVKGKGRLSRSIVEAL